MLDLFPLKIGDAIHFGTLRRFLSSADYTEETICRRLSIPSIYDFKTLREGRGGHSEINDRLDALIRLFMDQETIEESILVTWLGRETLVAITELALIQSLSCNPSRVYANAVLYPQEKLFIASDRTFLVDKTEKTSLPEDIVYASITRNSGRFVSMLPAEPCRTLLDLCSGTGIGALIGASRYARHSWACDLSKRCTHFATFNARLNDIGNFVALQGDLYAPVEGIRFDRVVAHPPYVPAEEQRLMFRDGGLDGEQILRGIVEGLPRFLNPGGRCYILTLVTDRAGETVEQRVRKWLAVAKNEFDVFLVINEAERRPDTMLQAVAEARGKLGELGPRSRIYEQLKVESILYGIIVVERHQTARVPLTARCQKSQTAGADLVEWFRFWQVSTVTPQFEETLLRSRPKPAPEFVLVVTHACREGQLVPVEFRMRTEHPIKSDARVEPWVAVLVGACDGSRSVVELFGYLREQEVITEKMNTDEFCTVIRTLLESGFLEIEEFKLPELGKNSAETSATLVRSKGARG